MEKELKELQKIFHFINSKNFAEKYAISYSHLRKTLTGERELFPDYYERIKECLEDFKSTF